MVAPGFSKAQSFGRLEEAHIKVSSIVSDLLGISARLM